MNVAVLNVATGGYIDFSKKLFDSINEKFLTEHNVDIFLFTDSNEKFANNVNVYKIKRKGFPGDTLFRYHYFLLAEKELVNYDFLFYLDADLLIEKPIGDEIISDLVAVQHPGFYGKNNGTFERRKQSSAFVDLSIKQPYYCGGVQGGRSKDYLEACKQIKNNINRDISNGIMAVWHDESHWNCYLAKNKPTLVLDPRYCYPTDAHFPWIENLSTNRKIITVEKDEDEIRKL
jgi:histo-blood group ABO system transferase